jgi:hypothetical protein
VLLGCAYRRDHDFSARHNSLGCVRDHASQRGGCALTRGIWQNRYSQRKTKKQNNAFHEIASKNMEIDLE